MIVAAIFFSFIAAFANMEVGYDQGQIWKAKPEVTAIAGAISFSTADAPDFLGHAAAAEQGFSPNEFMHKRHYRNAETYYQQRCDNAATVKRPLPSILIALLSPSDSTADLVNARYTLS